MTELQTERELGFAGLDLGIDPTKTRSLQYASGIRFDKAGTIRSRLGRVFASLDFPWEGYGTAADYVVNIPVLRGVSPREVLGMTPFYDQRIVTRTPQILDDPYLNETTANGSPQLWARANGFTFVDANYPNYPSYAQYTHNAGSNTLSQSSGLFVAPATLGATYVFEYTIFESTLAGGAMTITTAFANTTQSIPVTVGYHRHEFQANVSAITAFTLQVTSASGAFRIGLFSLKEKEIDGAERIPQRLNVVFKSNSDLIVNDGVNTPVSGKTTFKDATSRAVFVAHAGSVYIVDQSSKPKIMRRKPIEQQTYLKKVEYEVTEPFDWPFESTGVPTISGAVGGGVQLPWGNYRFRLTVTNKYGDESPPSLSGSLDVSTDYNYLVVDWSHMVNSFPSSDSPSGAATRVRLYVQYTASGTVSQEPSAFFFVRQYRTTYKSNAADPTGSFRFDTRAFGLRSNTEILREGLGTIPRLRAFIIVDDIGYGIPEHDFVQIEETISEGQTSTRAAYLSTRILGRQVRLPFTETLKSTESKIFKKLRLDPSMLVVSRPGEPFSLLSFVRFGRGGEYGTALRQIGTKIGVVTNKDIIIHDPDTGDTARTYSEIGTQARDSVEATESGIAFLGSDYVPRKFNGALIDGNFREIAPIFAEEDYTGLYHRFDRTRVKNVVSAYANSRFFMAYDNIDGERVLAVLDLRHGRQLWSIDASDGYTNIVWVPEEARLLATDSLGVFYFIEESQTVTSANGDTGPVSWRFTGRRFPSAAGLPGQFYRFAVEYTAAGAPIVCILQVDEDPGLIVQFQLTGTSRTRFVQTLPPTFKGRYLDVTFQGTTNGARQEVHDLQIEARQRGVF